MPSTTSLPHLDWDREGKQNRAKRVCLDDFASARYMVGLHRFHTQPVDWGLPKSTPISQSLPPAWVEGVELTVALQKKKEDAILTHLLLLHALTS